MDEPILTWYTQDINKDYVETETEYAGSYTQEEPLSIVIRLWNNRYGTKDVANIVNLKLNLYFKDAEDAYLLPYLTVATKKSQASLNISETVATAVFVEMMPLSGKANDGTDRNNPENYIDFVITLSVPKDVNLKTHDLKDLFVEAVDD